MEERFGIFKVNGENRHFGEIGTTGLTKLNSTLFNSPGEAVRYIDESPLIRPGASGFLIMPVYEYNKPVR